MTEKKKKKQTVQSFPIPKSNYRTVGRAGNSVSGVPWYSLYYGIGFGGWGGIYGTGYGSNANANPPSQGIPSQETSGDGTSSSNTGAGSGEGSGVGTM